MSTPPTPPAPDPAPRGPLDAVTVTAAVAGALAAAAAEAGVPAPPIGRVEVVARTASTSSDLVAAAADADAWPDRSVLVADHQVAGRGRAGRTWTTPAGVAVTVSVLARPDVPVDRLGWAPLLAGLAVVQAIADVTGLRASVKWPNDVLLPHDEPIEGWGPARKVAGVLGDLVTGAAAGVPGGGAGAGGGRGAAVVLGMGVNVAQTPEELPVPSATSLALAAGRPVDRTALLAALVARWALLDARWREHDGDAEAAGLAAQVAAVCSTLGAAVRVEAPGGHVVEGVATSLAPDGGLVVRTADGPRTVHAGDVRLRVAPA